MWDAVKGSPDVGAVIVYAAIATAVVAWLAIKTWYKNEAAKRDAEIKMEMLARGMSAADIVRVLGAKSENADLDKTALHKK